MKRGFLGGTFDPIHFGHINLALRMLEAHGLDQVLFCPTAVSPHKEQQPPFASKEHRLAMVEYAIKPIPQFGLCTLEIEQEKPYYTIDTIRILKKEHPNDQFHLLLGDDELKRLAEWKEIDELLFLAPPWIGTRHSDIKHLIFNDRLNKGFTKMPRMDISSTEIRSRLQKGLYCAHLVPANVLDYISSYQLYSMP